MDMLRAQDQKRDLHDHFNRQVTTSRTPKDKERVHVEYVRGLL